MMAFNFSKSAASWRFKLRFMMSKAILMRENRFARVRIVTRLPVSSGATRYPP